MKPGTCKVYIVDDDLSVRRGISLLLRSAGCQVDAFASAEEFLAIEDHSGEGCIILDIFMEGRSGLELQEEIAGKFPNLPIIFITGQGDIPMTVSALKKGAVNFLQKPVDDNELMKAVSEAMNLSHALVMQEQEVNHIETLIGTLTARELQVFKLIITGMLNKQIAAELNIAEHTVKLHRGKITEKLGLKSVAELVILSQKLNQI